MHLLLMLLVDVLILYTTPQMLMGHSLFDVITTYSLLGHVQFKNSGRAAAVNAYV